MVKTPFAILQAELDKTTTLADVEEYRKILESQNEVFPLYNVLSRPVSSRGIL